MPDILLVSRDADLLFRVERETVSVGCRIKSTTEPTTALDWLGVRDFAALVTDASISIEDQQRLAGVLWSKSPDAPLYVVSEQPADARARGGIRLFGAEPVSGPSVEKRLAEHLKRLQPPQVAETTGELNILVVEDLDAARDIICSYVEGMGYHAVAGDRSARSALQRLEVEGAKVSCIITDIRMPDMDGRELIQALRADKRFAHLPIIVLTAYGTADMLVECLKAGASGFLIKPPKKADLLRELARARRINRQGLEPRLAKPDEVEELRDLLAEKGLV